MTDGELVRLTLDGRPSAYEQLVRRWAPRVLAVCRARIRRAHVAEELAQESLLRAYRALPSLECPEKFGPWLRGIAVRVCLDWRKARQSSQVAFSQIAGAATDPLSAESTGEERLLLDEEHARLMEEVHELPEDVREAILLYYFDDMTYDEAAALLNVSRATVNARLAKGRRMLRRRLASLRD